MESAPIKLIWKWKNNKNKIQYNFYIFLGNKVTKNKTLMTVLFKIKELSLKAATEVLTKPELDLLNKEFSSQWYKYFFTHDHLKANLSVVNQLSNKKYILKGDGDDDDDEEEIIDTDEFQEIPDEEIKDLDVKTKEYTSSFEDLYTDDTSDTKTFLMMQKVIEEKKALMIKPIEFKNKQSNNSYDVKLSDVIYKVYVTSLGIYLDDFSREIKNKICSCLENNNDVLGKKLIPELVYLWIKTTNKSNGFVTNHFSHIIKGKRNNILDYEITPPRSIEKLSYSNLKINQLKQNKIKIEILDSVLLEDLNFDPLESELFMIDIYNDLRNIKTNKINDEVKMYLLLYFPDISASLFTEITSMLMNKIKPKEADNKHETLINDVILENEIRKTMESIIETEDYDKYFTSFHITQAVIHSKLICNNSMKSNLYRIFDLFTCDENVPFVYLSDDENNIIYKFNIREINKILAIKKNDFFDNWTKTYVKGLGFKILIGNYSFIHVSINDNYKLEFKVQWKESDVATFETIEKVYPYVNGLIKKINSYGNFFDENVVYNFAFLNVIQNFEFPKETFINHNKLTDVAKCFFTHTSIIEEPKKRLSKKKENTSGKYGTYFRYKRISEKENTSKIDFRFIYIIKNFDFTEEEFINLMSKQFNISKQKVKDRYDEILSKYPDIKKTKKSFKSVDELPKYKIFGIGIDIQGKDPKKYKIRISGIRNKRQLDRINIFLKIILHIYYNSYVLKSDKMIKIIDKISQLKKIAGRRNKVEVIKNIIKSENVIKKKINMDKKRIGFKPQKGFNQWSRSCQNNGRKQLRRPRVFNSSDVASLEKEKWKLNKETGNYEKTFKIGGDTIKLVTLKFKKTDDSGFIHYVCDPENNPNYNYVGLLSRSINPEKFCMPCCFKKDPTLTKNQKKKEFYAKCTSNEYGKLSSMENLFEDASNKLYILKNTNKPQVNRLMLMENSLDIIFNKVNEYSFKIKNNYLLSTKGYFFIYTVSQEGDPFINSMKYLFDLTDEEINSRLENSIKNEVIFRSIDNGKIPSQFKNDSELLFYINTSRQENNIYLINILVDIFKSPGTLSKEGFNIIIFKKEANTFKILRNGYPEDLNNGKKCLFFIMAESLFYPVVKIIKLSDKLITEKKHIFNSSDNNELSAAGNFIQIHLMI